MTIRNHQPTLALTLGDVAGIGPEITARPSCCTPSCTRSAYRW